MNALQATLQIFAEWLEERNKMNVVVS